MSKPLQSQVGALAELLRAAGPPRDGGRGPRVIWKRGMQGGTSDVTEQRAALFGKELRRLRTDAGLSLAQLSRLVHYSKGYLSKIETGARLPSAAVASRCDAAVNAGGALTVLVTARPARLANPWYLAPWDAAHQDLARAEQGRAELGSQRSADGGLVREELTRGELGHGELGRADLGRAGLGRA